jgi:thymidylate synthase (FAD)
VEIKVLDHGYVRLVTSWGSDEGIVEIARVSTNKGFLGWGPHHTEECAHAKHDRQWVLAASNEAADPGNDPPACDCAAKPGDEKLLSFLLEMHHDTPFEFAGVQFEIQAPIFCLREWHRHRTQSYSEISARYTPLPDVNYVPTVDRLMRNARAANKRNRQASSAEGALELTEELAELFRRKLVAAYEQDEDFYQTALGAGVPKELARVALPVGRYSRMRAQGVLRNWLAFLTLRKDSNAQWEIQEYANAVGEILKTIYPRTWALFELNHPGTWATETPAYYDHQITKLRARLETLEKIRAAHGSR